MPAVPPGMKNEHRFSTFCHDPRTRNLVVFGSPTLAEALVAAIRLEDVDGDDDLEVFIVDFETGQTVSISGAPAARAA